MPILVGGANGDQASFDAAISTAGIASAVTWYGWYRAISGGNDLFSLYSGSDVPIDIYTSSVTNGRYKLYRETATGVYVEWYWTGPSWSSSNWYFLALTQSGFSTPVVRYAGVNATSFTTPTVTLESGTPAAWPTKTGCYYVAGNFSGDTSAWDGDLAYQGLHSAVLTEGEIWEAYHRGMTLRAPVFQSPLESASKLYDLSGNAKQTDYTQGLSDSASAPPVVPLWVPTSQGWASSVVPTAAVTVIAPTGSMTFNAPTHIVKHDLTATAGLLTLSAANGAVTTMLTATSGLNTLSSGTQAVATSIEAAVASLTLDAGTHVAAPQVDVTAPVGSITLDSPNAAVTTSVLTVSGPLTMGAASAALAQAISTTAASATLGSAGGLVTTSLTATAGSVTIDAPTHVVDHMLTTVSALMTMGAGTASAVGQDAVVQAVVGSLTLDAPDGVELIGLLSRGNNWFILTRRRRLL